MSSIFLPASFITAPRKVNTTGSTPRGLSIVCPARIYPAWACEELVARGPPGRGSSTVWVERRAGDPPERRHRAELLVKRLKRIREDVGDL